MNCPVDIHIWILVIIMATTGAFGGFLNHLHNFDTSDRDRSNKLVKYKYIFLGIGAASLVPAFLKMIASDLIKYTVTYDNINYLIFAGFCIIAAIFSRKFISSIGERVLEAAQNAVITSEKAKKEVENTKLELSSTQDRIEDVKLAVDLKNTEEKDNIATENEPDQQLIEFVDSFIQKTSIPDYSERLKKKAELGRKMGQIIIRHNLPKEQLLEQHEKEGMYLALAYALELKPDYSDLPLLNKLSQKATQLYTKYVLLTAYRTFANSGLISREQAKKVKDLIEPFRINADKPLQRNIDDTINVLKFINPEL